MDVELDRFHFPLNVQQRQNNYSNNSVSNRNRPCLLTPNTKELMGRVFLGLCSAAASCEGVCVGLMQDAVKGTWLNSSRSLWTWRNTNMPLWISPRPPEATAPLSSSSCFHSLALSLHECSFSVSLSVLFVPFQFTYLAAPIPAEMQFQSSSGPFQVSGVISSCFKRLRSNN